MAIAYQIKGNEIFDNIRANMSPLHAPLVPERGQKVKTIFFLKMVMLHIELKRMTRTRPMVSVKMLKQFYSSHVAYELKGNACCIST